MRVRLLLCVSFMCVLVWILEWILCVHIYPKKYGICRNLLSFLSLQKWQWLVSHHTFPNRCRCYCHFAIKSILEEYILKKKLRNRNWNRSTWMKKNIQRQQKKNAEINPRLGSLPSETSGEFGFLFHNGCLVRRFIGGSSVDDTLVVLVYIWFDNAYTHNIFDDCV